MIKPTIYALLASIVVTRNPGMGGSLTLEGLKSGKNVVTSFVFDFLD